MGKVFQLLNRAEVPRRPPAEGPRIPDAGDAAPLETEAPGEEVPFIEVGPHKSVDASPCVLATAPRIQRGAQNATEEQAIAPFPVPAAEAVVGAEGRRRVAPELVAFHKPDDPAGERYRHILARLTRPRAEAPVRLLLLIPATAVSEELTATVLLNLGVTAARRDTRPVVVVDADFRQPRVARALGLAEHPGLGEVLAGKVALEEALQAGEPVNLLVLTAGGEERPGGVRFVSETVRSVLQQLRQRYDLVLVRGQTWDGGPDARHLAEVCDAVYPVLPEAEAAGPRLDELLQALPRQGAKLTGCILVS
jgi:Mrp family chromosome partitioning ATPase